ncbi:MAG: aspartate aminotransferase family protein [Hydrogenibacillus schlegelii]|uniref:alanine--glyoxylate transaminase n=1 Tax=Hydrogenibacillus schlegelii TaxID=1484 RepID=A0A947CYQ5_HYDSH|nr:aspartate aminotransferase family protein [Hydrogenibacillus schlegelii]
MIERTSPEALREQHAAYVFANVATYYDEPLVLVRGEGATVWDADGRSYLDAFGGILTVLLGHAHPAVTERVKAQVERLVHTSTLYVNEPMVTLAARLAEVTPGALKRSFFTNSGTEANETALLVARLYTGREAVLALRHSYHGRSALTLSAGGQGAYKAGGSLPGVYHLASPYCYRCPFGLTYPACDLRCAKDAEEVILTAAGGEVAAFIAEPIQGVGGFITPPPEYFKEVVAIVRRYGGIFIADEVQTGWGRTGRYLWGIEHWDVVPEVMTSAKGMANGFPIGWTIATEEVAAAFTKATISTFGGNPVSTAAALAVLDVVKAENLPENAERVGEALQDGLRALQDLYPAIGDVRGKGLMVGVELVHGGKRPAPDLLRRWMEAARKRGLLIGKGGLYGNVARIAPPITIGRSEAEEIVRILKAAMEDVMPYWERDA